MNREPVTDVIVVLPGIMGSVLRRRGEDVWSVSRGALFKNLLRGTGPIDALALSGDDHELDDLGDGVSADRLIDDVHMIPGLWSIDGYSKLRRRILALPGVTQNENYFELPYDWRRDNRVAARRLSRLSDVWLDRWRNSAPERRDARLVLVAHSMGGLVSRYFLEVLGGWKQTRQLITLGTPYRGSLNALDFVVNGMKKNVGPVTLFDLGDVVRSLTSVYQLLPTFTCWDTGDGTLLTLSDAGEIPGLPAARVTAAKAFHDEIDDAVKTNAKEDAYWEPETGYLLHAIAGISQPTVQSALVTAAGVEFQRRHGGVDRDGDGRVMRESAAPLDKRQAATVFYSQAHASLQNDEAAVVQVQALITAPREGLRDEPTRFEFGLDIADAYASGEEIPFRVPVKEDVPPLTATAVDTATDEHVIDRMRLERSDDGYVGTFPALIAGTYRVVVDGDGVAPLADTFLVVD